MVTAWVEVMVYLNLQRLLSGQPVRATRAYVRPRDLHAKAQIFQQTTGLSPHESRDGRVHRLPLEVPPSPQIQFPTIGG